MTTIGAVLVFTMVSGSAWAAPVLLDTSFSGDRKTSFGGPGYQFVFGLETDGDAVYGFGGSAKNWNKDSRYQLVVRYRPNGTLDKAFANHGVRKLNYTSQSSATDAALLADGSLLVIGWTDTGLAITKLRTDGTLVKRFGNRGTKRIPVKLGASNPQIAETPSGGLVAAWSQVRNWDTRESRLQITRLRRDGTTVGSFGRHGVRTLDYRRRDALNAMEITSAGQAFLSLWSESARDPRGVVRVVGLSPADKVWSRSFNEYGRHGTYTAGPSVDDSDRAVVGVTPYNRPGVGAIRLNADGSRQDVLR